jgi:GntR family transcriptional repressor for pyruvate dehydrogenase complex
VSQFSFPLYRDKLYEQVADQIQELIVAESLRPGDKLPCERDLAERLGVSRTVIREAIRALCVRGLVKVKAGCGTYVQQPTLKDMAAPIGLLLKLRQCPDTLNDLYEVRCMIEVECAGLAAGRATEEDCAVLEVAIEEMKAHVADAEEFIRRDLVFHSSLADATHNDLFSVLLSVIGDLWLEAALLTYQAPGAAESGLKYHRKIMQRIKERDTEGARRAMRDHIRHSRNLAEAARGQVALHGGVSDGETTIR